MRESGGASDREEGDRASVTITAADIRKLVDTFYDRVRAHETLGPIFEARLAGRWPDHLDRMYSFWTSVLLGARSYRGDPMDAHARIPGIDPAHFAAWMELFTATARDVLAPVAAADVVGRAARMRQALERFACDVPGEDPDARADPHPPRHISHPVPAS